MNDQDSIFSVRFLRFRREEFYHEGHEVHEEKLLEILHGPSCASWLCLALVLVQLG
jgi:hypothetical protein